MAQVEGTGGGGGKPKTPKPKKPGVYNPLWWVPAKPKPKDNDNKGKLPKPKPKPTPAPSGGGGGGGSGGGGSGGGGGAGDWGGGEGVSKYLQEYRLRFYTNGKPPAALLQKAKDNNWSIAYFDMQIRLQDKSYISSKEAKPLAIALKRTMSVLFPNFSGQKQSKLMRTPYYKNLAMWYLKNGIGLQGKNGQELLYARITGTKKWNKENPYYKAYARNQNAAVQGESNPLVYTQLEDALKQSFTNVGLELPDDYYKTFFRSRYASTSGVKDMGDNLKTLAMGRQSQGWFQGTPMDSQQIKTAALDSEGKGNDLRSRLQKSFGIEKSFKGAQEQGFGASMDERGKLVKKTI